MRFYSTNNRQLSVSLREAVLKGLAEDKGLFMPERIPVLAPAFINDIAAASLAEIGFQIARLFVDGEIDDAVLQKITEESVNFKAPCVEITADTCCLELFHGPTLAFKDFGARFMARLMSYFLSSSRRRLTILAATSGDTGSAVGNGFSEAENIDVILLYPSNKVSRVQEMQLTTIGGNVTALEIEGNFDDCQRLVKAAFVDPELQQNLMLSSANSINIARLIPQIFYYFHAWAQLRKKELPLLISVPSGNFGNLTAGLMAKQMGLPVAKFIAATNINDVVPCYLEKGLFQPRASQETISNAMDVGNPSNFARMLELYRHSRDEMAKDIYGSRFSDSQTRQAIAAVAADFGYVMDPHAAVGCLALQEYRLKFPGQYSGVFLGTAHPAKFADVVEPVIGRKIELPKTLADCLAGEKRAVLMPNNFDAFKEYLLAKS